MDISPTMRTGQMHSPKKKNGYVSVRLPLRNVFFSLAAAVCDANLGRKQEGMGTMHSFNYGSIPIRRVETHEVWRGLHQPTFTCNGNH